MKYQYVCSRIVLTLIIIVVLTLLVRGPSIIDTNSVIINKAIHYLGKVNHSVSHSTTVGHKAETFDISKHKTRQISHEYCVCACTNFKDRLGPVNSQLIIKDPAEVTNLTLEASKETSKQKTCSTLSYISPPGPRTALVSFPGSGNTWVRHLLQQATGYYTGSVYDDDTLRDNGYPGEGVRDGKVVAVKTHYYGSNCSPKYDRVILLMRHPVRTLLADFNRQATVNDHMGKAHPALFEHKLWLNFTKTLTEKWMQFHTYWLGIYSGKILVVHYEKLMEDVAVQVKRMAAFLNVSVNDTVMACTALYSAGTNQRRQKNQDGLEMFTDQMLTDINDVVLQLGQITNKKFPDVYNELKEFNIN